MQETWRMTGSNAAILNHAKSTRVSLCLCDHFTFEGKESRIQEGTFRNCDIKVRGSLGSGKRDARELEFLGRTVRWTDEGLECEAK